MFRAVSVSVRSSVRMSTSRRVPSSLAVSAITTRATTNLSTTLTDRRWQSTDADSHSDFAPQRKYEPEDPESVRTAIDEAVKANKVMLYMKGVPEAPQCGFSMQVVRILHAMGVDFAAVNVLEHPDIREGIKSYSDWPTIPQLFVNGEFVGGCDIVTTMFQNGELEELFEGETA